MKKISFLFYLAVCLLLIALQVSSETNVLVPEVVAESPIATPAPLTDAEVTQPQLPSPVKSDDVPPVEANEVVAANTENTEDDAREDIINEEIIGKSEVVQIEEANTNTVTLNSKPKERIILGWVEPILLGQKNLSIDAKLTPGTAGNSLHADNIVMSKKKNGAKWVDFDVTDKLGRTVRFHKKVISMREKSDPKLNQYKVTLEFCLNMQHFNLDFIVSNRSDFEHPARIGRDSLAGHFIIDPGLTKISVPSCK